MHAPVLHNAEDALPMESVFRHLRRSLAGGAGALTIVSAGGRRRVDALGRHGCANQHTFTPFLGASVIRGAIHIITGTEEKYGS